VLKARCHNEKKPIKLVLISFKNLSWSNLNFTKITSDCQLKLQNYWYLSFYNNINPSIFGNWLFLKAY